MNTLDELYFELETVLSMSEEEVCEKYNAEKKADITFDIQEEIKALRNKYKVSSNDDGMDYDALCVSQGLSTNMSFIKY